MTRFRKQLIRLLFAASILTQAHAVTLVLNQENLSLQARDETLGEILRQFAAAGVKVNWDPGADAAIDAHVVDQPIEKTLKTLLGAFNYSLTWEPIDTPHGRWLKLDEIAVYRPGHWQNAQAAFTDEAPEGDIVWLPDGTGYIKNEILLGLKPGTKRSDLMALLKGICANVVSANKKFGIYRIRFCDDQQMNHAVSALKNSPLVAVAEPNYALKPMDPQPYKDPAGENKPGKDSKPGPVAPNSPTIAVLDTGLSPDISLGDALQGGYDAVNPGRTLGDNVGHGSQMALIASGIITPEGGHASDNTASVLAIRAFDENGRATSFGLMNAMEYAIENDAGIISMSWGTYADSDLIEGAINYAQNNDTIVLAAAGNDGSGQAMYPAAYPGVLSVGALDPDGTVWNKSNYGPHVDIVAPGYANFPIGNGGPPGGYHGTSGATQYVANQIARYKANHLNTSNKAITQHLLNSVTDIGPPGKDQQSGHGALDTTAIQRFHRN